MENGIPDLMVCHPQPAYAMGPPTTQNCASCKLFLTTNKNEATKQQRHMLCRSADMLRLGQAHRECPKPKIDVGIDGFKQRDGASHCIAKHRWLIQPII